MSKLPFEVDATNKVFVLSAKNYEELFIEGTPVNKAFKAAMALGCYDGYVPVMKDGEAKAQKKKEFTEEGVITWIEANRPDWKVNWEASKVVKMADNKPFPFMVRKNYFLYENPEARVFCGMKKMDNKKEEDAEGEGYELKPKAKALKGAVENYLAKKK